MEDLALGVKVDLFASGCDLQASSEFDASVRLAAGSSAGLTVPLHISCGISVYLQVKPLA